MKTKPKYLEVLKYLYDKKPKSIHYIELTPVIYSDDTIKKYRHARNRKVIIDGMVCRYMGKLCNKNFAGAEYKHIHKGNSFFVGYYIRPDGIALLRKYELI